MGGVKTIDMRAHGSQKLWQKPCAHIKQKHKHMVSKTESLAMCRTGHEHAANKETHKPHVHTKHDKHESMQPMNTQAACHTEQDKTRESKTKTTKTHGQRSALSERTRDRMLPQQEKTWNVSIRTPTRNHNGAWNKTRVPGSEHHAPTRVAMHPDFGRTVWIFLSPLSGAASSRTLICPPFWSCVMLSGTVHFARQLHLSGQFLKQTSQCLE